MSLSAAIKFRAQVNSDPALQARVRELVRPGETLDVAGVAATLGFSFGRDEAKKAFGGPQGDELSDFELEMVHSAVPTNCNQPDQNNMYEGSSR